MPKVFTKLGWLDIGGLLRARVGVMRSESRIAPGLYCTGKPDDASPVLVTANYKLSFDSLRRKLSSVDAWLLVLDTRGVNVWCAAAHKTFGTDELISRLKKTGVENVVGHRKLILPQLGAPGVDAQQVMKASGFEVVWGPVRAGDLPGFLENRGQADEAMRRVTFNLAERLVLSPVELSLALKPSLIILAVMLVISGIGPGFFSLAAAWSRWQLFVPAFLAGLFSGAVLTPALLPWLPFRSFYLKGLFAAFPAVAFFLRQHNNLSWPELLALVLVCLTISSYGAMNFTGATPFVSPSGVEKEMRHAIPVQLIMSLTALTLWLVIPFILF
ncbi:MAG: mercury methylation corrinoid protein HgcA [Thermodesulfobacteriota bacterium]